MRGTLLGPDDPRCRYARTILLALGPLGDWTALMVHDTPDLGATAYGSREKPYVACTTGLIELLDPDELKAIFAHELAHIELVHGEVRPLLCRVPLGGRTIMRAVEVARARRREIAADGRVADIGGDPQALKSALTKMGDPLVAFGLWKYLTIATHPRHKARFRRLNRHSAHHYSPTVGK